MLTKNKSLLMALCAIALSLCFWGCRKSTHPTMIHTPVSDEIPDWAKTEMRKQKGGFTYVVNKKSPVVYLDQQGNERKFDAGRLMDIPCDQEEDDFLNNEFTHLYQSIWYVCGQDFKVVVEYELSTAFTPVLTNPANPSQVSRGRFRIIDPNTNATLYTNSNVTPVTITHVGPDPNNADKQLYRISYTVTGLTEAQMTTGGSFENRPIIYSDCPDVITTAGSWLGAIAGAPVDACSKVDRISMVPGGGNRVVFVGGCDEQISTVGSCYPPSLASGRPHEHDVEWRKPGDATYGNWPAALPTQLAFLTVNSYNQRIAWPYTSSQACTMYPNKKEKLQFFTARSYQFPVSGNIEVRYRNVKVTTFGSNCSGTACTSPDWVYFTINVQ